MRWKNIVIASLVLLVWSCGKEEENDPLPTISSVPAISLVRIEPGTLDQFEDITFTIRYQDGDGDLGHEDADSTSVFITDNRSDLLHAFHLQPLAPEGSSITIEGILEIELENVILMDQDNSSEEATFSIYIVDRAGNTSNTVTSTTVVIENN